MNLSTLVPANAALGKYIGPPSRPFAQRPRNDHFRVAQTVSRSRIDPIDAPFQGTVNGGDGVVVILSAPGKFPAPAANRPGAEADRSDFQVRGSKLSGIH